MINLRNILNWFVCFHLICYSIEALYISNHKNCGVIRSSLLQTSFNPLSYDDVQLTYLNIFDFPQIFLMCNRQFTNNKSTVSERLDLYDRILKIFLPNLLKPTEYGHDIIGLKTNWGQIIGFADVSLQVDDGSLDALCISTLPWRIKKHSRKKLQPYLCNLLVSPEYRKRGFAKRLISACENHARQWNNIESGSAQYLHLHVELTETPALCLYLSAGFTEIRRVKGNDGKTVLFMRRPISPLNLSPKDNTSIP